MDTVVTFQGVCLKEKFLQANGDNKQIPQKKDQNNFRFLTRIMKNSKAGNPTQEKNQKKFLVWHCFTRLDSTQQQEEDKGTLDGYTQAKNKNI